MNEFAPIADRLEALDSLEPSKLSDYLENVMGRCALAVTDRYKVMTDAEIADARAAREGVSGSIAGLGEA